MFSFIISNEYERTVLNINTTEKDPVSNLENDIDKELQNGFIILFLSGKEITI